MKFVNKLDGKIYEINPAHGTAKQWKEGRCWAFFCMVCERQWFVHTEEWDNDTVEEVLSIVLSEHPNTIYQIGRW